MITFEQAAIKVLSEGSPEQRQRLYNVLTKCGGPGGKPGPCPAGGSGDTGRVAELSKFASTHGGRVSNEMLLITPPKLLSGNRPGEVGPSSMKVRTTDGKVTIRRTLGQFRVERPDGVSSKLNTNEELTITHLKW